MKKETKIELNKEFFSYSWPIMFLTITFSIFYWIDSFTIGYFKDAIAVGFYNAAVPIVALMGFVPELFMQLFFPLITKEFSKKNFKVIKELSKQVGKWTFIFNLPLFLIIFLFPGAIINILFGAEYIIAQNALRILIIGSFISSSFWISHSLLSMTGRSKLILFNLVGVSIINLILNIALVPKYGINGAAFATTISWIILSFILLFEVKHFIFIIPTRRKILRIFLISLIPTFLLIYSKKFVPINFISLILLGTFFLLSYLFLIFITGCLDKNDFMILKSLKKKITFRMHQVKVNELT